MSSIVLWGVFVFVKIPLLHFRKVCLQRVALAHLFGITVRTAAASISAIERRSFVQMQKTQRTLAADPIHLDVTAELDLLRTQASLLVGIFVPFCHEGMIA